MTAFTSPFEICVASATASINWFLVIFAMIDPLVENDARATLHASLCSDSEHDAPLVISMVHEGTGFKTYRGSKCKATHCRSVAHRSRPAQLHLAQGECERHGCKRNQHQDPERVQISQKGRLRLQLLSNPRDGLLLCLGERAAVGGEIVYRLLQCVLILGG